MKSHRSHSSGAAVLALMAGLLAPVMAAPNAFAAPAISTSTVLAAGATGSAGAVITISGSGFKSGLANSDFVIGGTNTSMTVNVSSGGSTATSALFLLGGTAVLNETIEITAKRSAYATDPGADSNTVTVTVVAAPTPATIASTSTLQVGSVNPSITVNVTNTQVDFSTVTTVGNYVVSTGTTGLTLSSVSWPSGSVVILNFSGTVQAGTLTVAAGQAIFNPATGGQTNTLTFTAVAAPEIDTTSTIAVGTASPTVTVTGSNFAANIALSDLTITAGATGLTPSSVSRVNASELTLGFTGTAAAGTLDIQAKTTAFDPVESLDSNTLSIIISPPADVIVTGPSQSPTITPSSISVAVGGTFIIENQSNTDPYSIRSDSGSVSRNGNTCSQVMACLLTPGASLTLTVDAQGTVTVSGGTLTIGSSPNPGPAPTPATPPSAPASAEAIAGNGEATVSWTAPSSQGSFPVTNYQVQSTRAVPAASCPPVRRPVASRGCAMAPSTPSG